jgi:hypothetical protein
MHHVECLERHRTKRYIASLFSYIAHRSPKGAESRARYHSRGTVMEPVRALVRRERLGWPERPRGTITLLFGTDMRRSAFRLPYGRPASHRVSTQGGEVYARVATFQGDPANVEDAIKMVRAEVEAGKPPPGLEGAKMLMLVNRESGQGLGVSLFESEEAMRRGDEALNAMNPGAGERRTSVEFYEVPVQTVS